MPVTARASSKQKKLKACSSLQGTVKVKIGSRVINCPQPYVIVKDPVKVNQPPGGGYKRKAEAVLVSSGRGGNVQVGVGV